MQSGPEPVLEVGAQLRLHSVLSALKEELLFEAVKIWPRDVIECRRCRLPDSGGIVLIRQKRIYYNLSYYQWGLFQTIFSL
jgi:hypothetical protein